MTVIKEKLASTSFLLAILLFILSFNFSDNPPPSGWYQQFMPNLGGRSISDITFLDSLIGYATAYTTTDTNYLLKTINGGDNWNIIYREYRVFNRIQFLNQNTGYICGGNFERTTNGGINWASLNAPPNLYQDMSILNIDTMWLVTTDGLTGGVFRTTNGGANWERQLDLGSQNPDHIYMFNGRLGFIAEINNYVRRTSDGGQTWSVVVNGQSFIDMYFVDSLTGWRGPGLFKTTDGGFNWVQQTFPPTYLTGATKFSNVSRDTIWAVGGTIAFPNNQTRGLIYKTTNGGSNWGYQIPDTTIHIFAYGHNKFVDRLNGWAYAFAPTGVHTTTGGDTTYMGIKEINTRVPNEFILGQNYPNPFNISSKFIVQSSKSASIEVKVFDITGRLVAVLVNQKLSAGEYELTFDARDLPSGVYFYTLIVDGTIIDTKRAILIK